jgi:hypothetical protein
MDIEEVFKFYRTEFVPAYSDLVGYIGDKPQQMVIELENTFTHISQYFNPILDIRDKDKNLEKAYDHLVRATLDCYKLLWVTMHEQLGGIEEDEGKRKLGLNISEAEFLTKFQKIKKLAQEARRIEMTSVGLSPIESLDKYKEVVKYSYELIDTIDENKMQEIKSLKKFVSTKEFIIGTAVGILAGLISGYLLHLFIASPTP